MSTSPLVSAIAKRLRAAGYSDVATPFRVASVSFDFTRVMRGRDGRAHDLVIVIDTATGEMGDTDSVQVRRRIETLSRALDVVGSRLVLTVVLAGASTANDIEALSETCRVLVVEPIGVGLDGVPKDKLARQQLDDRIRLLLPLEIPPRDEGLDVEPAADEALKTKLPNTIDKNFLQVLLNSSRHGEDAVEREMRRVFDDRMKIEDVS
ncbi:hypothetical protein K1W69_24670 [Hoeflea sp. WL0058]|uniref:Uncharacterized protein n=1 Tax=Flavimaribacter sediminis TaxID=2865987 RepID=A0AAE2ZR07_9HYPH|nr:hypothetical protein [Flavimaribacter sediminis]MBW8640409.1 hypothetical protein [Flavimaribacter sediminis]